MRFSALAAAVAAVTVVAGVSYAAPVSMSNDLKGWTGTSQVNRPNQVQFLTDAGFEVANVFAWSDTSYEMITFNSSGATFGLGNAGGNANTLRTIESNYASVSCDAYATATDITADTLFGLGAGTAAGWSTDPGKAVYVKMAGGNVTFYTNTTGSTPISAAPTGAVRFHMHYDATAQTAAFEVDNNYNGTFTPDFTSGALSTAGLFDATSAKLFMGGGYWTTGAVTFSDFSVAVPEPTTVALTGLASLGLLRRRKTA